MGDGVTAGPANEVLQGIHWDREGGALHFKGIRYMLVRPDTITTFQQAVESHLGEATGSLMFTGGKAGGSATARKLHHEFGRPAGEIAHAMCTMGGQLGWGALRVAELSLDAGRLVIEVANSAFAAAYGPSSQPVCHFICGVFAGVAEIVLGGEVEPLETECLACGGRLCRFIYQAVR